MDEIREENLPSVGKGIAKGLVSVIPVLGNTAVAIYDELASKQIERKLKRLVELYNSLKEDLSKCQDQINDDCIHQEDFLDIFEQTTNQFINERNGQKRRLLKNILEHTITDKDFNFDVTEKFMRILGQLDSLEIEILAVLYKPSEYNIQHGKIIGDPINNEFQTSWGEYSAGGVLTRLLNKKDYEIRSAVSYLYINGLLETDLMEKKIHTNANPIHVLDNTLSILGRQFVAYCIGI